jgi:hypothetical protein
MQQQVRAARTARSAIEADALSAPVIEFSRRRGFGCAFLF